MFVSDGLREACFAKFEDGLQESSDGWEQWLTTLQKATRQKQLVDGEALESS